ITAVGTFYTTLGGVRAVVWVDTIQFAIVIGAAFLTIGILLHRIPLSAGQIVDLLKHSPTSSGGHSKLLLIDTSLNFRKPYTLWAGLFGAVFLHTAAYGVDHDLAQRFLVSKSVVRGGISVIASQLIAIATITIFLCIGMLLYIFYKRPDVMGQTHAYPGLQQGLSVYPWFLLNELPPVLSGIAIAGFFAVAQGSMDSAMNALASSIVADLYVPWRKRMGHDVSDVASGGTSKLTVALVGLALCLFAILCAALYDPKNQTLLDFALGVLTFSFAGMLGVFLTALLTKRGNSTTVIVALFVGVVTVVLLQDRILGGWTQALFGTPCKLAWPWWMPIGTAASFIACVLGSPRRPRAEGFPVIPKAATLPPEGVNSPSAPV
ncbi:MAG TPA: hypothetical protein VLJ39_05795, partial [Tepidisphaeraceae bacterium]|nr:hypothetical protein [Tepidisphaeraceae bacterium]